MLLSVRKVYPFYLGEREGPGDFRIRLYRNRTSGPGTVDLVNVYVYSEESTTRILEILLRYPYLVSSVKTSFC